MSRITAFSEWILRLPLVWGGVACLAFYALLSQGLITHPTAIRYFASHPMEYITTALFFIGVAALVMRMIGLIGQYSALGRVKLGLIPIGGQRVADSSQLMDELSEFPSSIQHTYFVRRLRDALEFVRRKDSAESLDDHLRHLEEVDLAEKYAGYSIVRIIIWAIPILGFLGTVIGITIAITKLSPTALEKSLSDVTDGLGVAFDTTALALALSIVLMFGKFLVEHFEDRLLTAVDNRTGEEMVGRFQQAGSGSDPHVAAIGRMSQQVIEAVEAMAARQAQVWKMSIDETHQQWAEVSTAAGKTLETALDSSLRSNLTRYSDAIRESTSQHAEQLGDSTQEALVGLRGGLEKLAELLVEALHKHGEVLTDSERELAQENRRHLSEVEAALGEAMVVSADRQEALINQAENLLKEMQLALVEAADSTVRQQEQLIKQGDVLLKVVDATGQIKTLEDTLNHNLAALSQSQNFEDTVLSLSAAIGLLNARLGRIATSVPTVDIVGDDNEPTSHAA